MYAGTYWPFFGQKGFKKGFSHLGCPAAQSHNRTYAAMTERMTWEPSSKRWVKKLDGRQIWASYRKLKKMFPALVSADSRIGTRAAANAFWEQLLAERNEIPELPDDYRRAIAQHEDMRACNQIAFERVPKEFARRQKRTWEKLNPPSMFGLFEFLPNENYEDERELIRVSIAWNDTQIIRLNSQGRFAKPPPLLKFDTPLDCMLKTTRNFWENSIRELDNAGTYWGFVELVRSIRIGREPEPTAIVEAKVAAILEGRNRGWRRPEPPASEPPPMQFDEPAVDLLDGDRD